MSNQQLQLALAKMLPETLRGYNDCVCWLTGGGSSTPHWVARNHPVEDTEWLHICWLVEQTLTAKQEEVYVERLSGLIMEGVYSDEDARYWKSNLDSMRATYRASWQQRAEALCKVKGIEG